MAKTKDWPTDRQIRERIAERLRKARTGTNLLQKQLAAGCGISASVQSRYESGAMAPSWAYLYRLEKTYRITASYLITGSKAGMGKAAKNRVKNDQKGTVDRQMEIGQFPLLPAIKQP